MPDDWNSKIIAEFRANGGKVGGPFEGGTLLLLHTTGARTGQERVNPVMYRDLGDGSYAVFASKGGAPTHPDWYHNLVANPRVSAEIGTRTRAVHRAGGRGRRAGADLGPAQGAEPGFADYERNTTRQIPVVILDPVAGLAHVRPGSPPASAICRLVRA